MKMQTVYSRYKTIQRFLIISSSQYIVITETINSVYVLILFFPLFFYLFLLKEREHVIVIFFFFSRKVQIDFLYIFLEIMYSCELNSCKNVDMENT